ncbi:phospholipase domain-containing protein [Paenibacillus physcomitrellae]|uniref:Bacterial phospholipase C C-terminal domain-containing protein n=1 Tax=Paenibacillus physcomitrellae TaxID=1619311 RepID=A0ABQ1GGH1_9BACL|nr:phospholipase domain-containing protein [Paenibacillus physcomitrellae]GGA43181.1 hypothetical protein GCM10010917_30600 [Paenibacillus physcomitrellae]
MTSKTMKMVGATAFSLSLVLGAFSAVSAADLNPKATEESEVIEITPFAITGEWTLNLEGGSTTYTKTLAIAKGSGNLKLQAKNTGTQSYRVTLQSNDYPEYGVILDATVKAGETFDWTKNGGGVPSGSYTLQVHGSAANPKGIVYLKSSDIPW